MWARAALAAIMFLGVFAGLGQAPISVGKVAGAASNCAVSLPDEADSSFVNGAGHVAIIDAYDGPHGAPCGLGLFQTGDARPHGNAGKQEWLIERAISIAWTVRQGVIGGSIHPADNLKADISGGGPPAIRHGNGDRAVSASFGNDIGQANPRALAAFGNLVGLLQGGPLQAADNQKPESEQPDVESEPGDGIALAEPPKPHWRITFGLALTLCLSGLVLFIGALWAGNGHVENLGFAIAILGVILLLLTMIVATTARASVGEVLTLRTGQAQPQILRLNDLIRPVWRLNTLDIQTVQKTGLMLASSGVEVIDTSSYCYADSPTVCCLQCTDHIAGVKTELHADLSVRCWESWNAIAPSIASKMRPDGDMDRETNSLLPVASFFFLARTTSNGKHLGVQVHVLGWSMPAVRQFEKDMQLIGGTDRKVSNLWNIGGNPRPLLGLHLVKLSLHDNLLAVEYPRAQRGNDSYHNSEEPNSAGPNRHHALISLVVGLLLAGLALSIVAAFKVSEYADDHGWPWWIPLFGFLGLAALFGLIATHGARASVRVLPQSNWRPHVGLHIVRYQLHADALVVSGGSRKNVPVLHALNHQNSDFSGVSPSNFIYRNNCCGFFERFLRVCDTESLFVGFNEFRLWTIRGA